MPSIPLTGRRVLVAAALALVLPLSARALPAPVVNARLDTRSAAAGLEAIFRATRDASREAAWIGYEVPANRPTQSCCGDSDNDGCCWGCRLEGKSSAQLSAERSDLVRLEPSHEIAILFRVEGGEVQKIRSFSSTCRVDAGGLAFHWLSDVKPAESLALLSWFVGGAGEARESRGLSDGALAAIAFHAGDAAEAALERFVGKDRQEAVRKQAAFWLGNSRGRAGFETLRRLVREDADERFREHVIFALTQSSEPEAVPTIIDVARRDASTRVRGQALFWLGQKAGQKAVAAIREAATEDPAVEVKKKAVFALSQLPKDEGVPLLIDTARHNKSPEVRKQAMFWLGQSKDPRAVTFFEEVLTH